MKLDKLVFICIVLVVSPPPSNGTVPFPSRLKGRSSLYIIVVILLLLAIPSMANAEATLTEVVAAINSEKVVDEAIKTEIGPVVGSNVQELLSTIKSNTTSTNGTIGTYLPKLAEINTKSGEISTKTGEGNTKLGELKISSGEVKTAVSALKTSLESRGFTAGSPLYTSSVGGGGGSTEVTSFGSSAQTNLSEFQEHLETVGWCVIGTLIAMAIALFTLLLLRPKR